jgi:hypothetical protein
MVCYRHGIPFVETLEGLKEAVKQRLEATIEQQRGHS